MFGTSTNLTIRTEGTLRTDGTGTVHSVESLPRDIAGTVKETITGKEYEIDWKITDGTLTMTPQEGRQQPELEYLLREPSSIRKVIKGVEAAVDLSEYEVKSIFGLVTGNTTAAKKGSIGTNHSLGAMTRAVE